MNIILLSGGSGKRLWPLSNDARSKQFLRLLDDGRGGHESMVQRVYRQIGEAKLNASIVIATGRSQIDPIKSQLGRRVDIVVEPARRDTFPAIALSCAYLYFEKKLPADAPVVILPVDPCAEDAYFQTLAVMERELVKTDADIVLMGVKPTYPSEKYGYIVPEGEADASGARRVKHFTEKPDLARAERLLSAGALWNGGVFAVKLGYVMALVEKTVRVSSYDEMLKHFSDLEKTSFDYAVVEKAKNIRVVPYGGKWKDLGTWNTLTEEMGTVAVGAAIFGEESANTTVVNELGIPIVALGMKDAIIAASPDGILVSDKAKSSYLKPYVDAITERPMFEERRWGEYRVIDYVQYDDRTRSLTKHLTMHAGRHISYQVHSERDEIWTIVHGSGEMMLDGHRMNIQSGDVIHINRGQKHAVRALTDLHFIEVQIGDRLEEDDIERFEIDW